MATSVNYLSQWLVVAYCLEIVTVTFYLKFIVFIWFFQRNHHGPAENTADPSQTTQNGSVDDKNNSASPLFPGNIPNPMESDFSMMSVQKGHIPGSSAEAVPLTMQMRLDMFDPVVSSGMTTQHLQESVSNVDMHSHTQPQLWLDKSNKGNYILPHDSTMKEQEELVIESGSDSISSAYSQG